MVGGDGGGGAGAGAGFFNVADGAGCFEAVHDGHADVCVFVHGAEVRDWYVALRLMEGKEEEREGDSYP